MNRFPVPFKVVATSLLTGLVVLISLLNLRDRSNWTDPWDGVLWGETAHGFQAQEVSPDSPGQVAGIKEGEVLLSINARQVANLGNYSDLLYWLGPNSAATYTLKGPDAATRDVPVQIGAKRFMTRTDALRIVLAFFHLGIGVFVILRGSRLPRSFHFYIICLTAFVVYFYRFTPKWDGLDKVVYGFSFAAFLLLPVLFLHFCMRFTLELSGGRSHAPLLYIPAAALGLLHLLWLSGHLVDWGLPRDALSAQLMDRIQLIYLCAGFFIGAILLWRKRALARDLITRQQMKWVSYGTMAGILPFSMFYALPFLLGARPGFAMEASMLFLGFIPLSFAYAIVHYRLLDVEVLFRRGAAYFIASSLLLAIYLFFVLVLGRALEWVAPEADFLVICIAALAIALLFAPVRNRVQARLDRFFYKDRFDDRAGLQEFARMLTTEISLGRLSRSVLERVSKTFQVETAALFVADSCRPGFLHLTDELGLRMSEYTDSLAFSEDQLLDRERPSGLAGVDVPNRLHRASPVLAMYGLHYLQDLNLRGRRIGMIGLGELPRGKHFSSEDLDLLGALAGYAAIALENASLYRSVEIKALELERLKIYTENILESINVAVLVLDLEGKITSCNRAFEELYDVPREEVRDASVEDLFAPDVIASIHRVTGAEGWALQSISNIYKLYLQNRRGVSLIVNVSVIPLMDATDQITGCVIVMDDITFKVRLEEQLLQAEKLSSIGLLAAGIAHEVNTPLTGISSYTQMLLKETPDHDKRKTVLEKIEKQTFRAAEIVNGLLSFARMNGSEFGNVDVNQLIQESLSLLDHQLKQCNIRLESHLERSLPRVHGNGGKLQQVLINLLLNARDAMPSGGLLEIETSMNDSMVLVDIRDTGVGISQENIKRIYDPFFTTKSTGNGTGLGLAVTYGIIQEHGGRIFVDSTPGKGTHFRLKLPTQQALSA